VDKTKLVAGTRVVRNRNVMGVADQYGGSTLTIAVSLQALDMTTLTIMRILPREVDPMVFNMLSEDPGKYRLCCQDHQPPISTL
jgi:ATP-dependent 26S proteasome regulatory subunit